MLAAVAIAAAGGAWVDASREAASPAPARLTTPNTPVLSLRRTPAAVTRLVADMRLVRALDKTSKTGSSCLVVKDAGRTLYSRDPDTPLAPASTMKVLTASAAIDRMGADFRFETRAVAARPPAGGVIDGPLWLVGSGDPILATVDYAASFTNQPQVFTNIEDLAQKIVDAGVHEIRGGVVGDESRYDTERYRPTWKPTYITDFEIGPSSSLTVNDNFEQWKPHHVATASPARYGAAVLANLLKARGVVIDADVGEGQAPDGTKTVAAIKSPPLADIVGEMLRESDNMTAELLVKELGRRFRSQGTWAAGTAEVRSALSGEGLPLDGFSAVDGSGLDLSDRVTCRLLQNAIDKAGPDSPLVKGFPVAGQSGTLTKRFLGSPAAGHLTAKTGTLDFVVGLAGYAEGGNGHRLSFSLVANDLPDKTATGRAIQDRVGAALVAYPDAPSGTELGP